MYASDNGFLSLGQSISANHGKLLENLICNELQKNGYEIYFYHKEVECDFIARKADRTIAIQVCYELNEHNQKRELNGLLKLPFAVDERVIIT
ncbi:DUF4143 domain-containing protein [Chrysiogenes arsenatis]|uniref:DUF4143 domain-containing protein n=1 Tax=Chrysiogenes arsenatis TaxID=309797 RepID=UPI00191C2B5A